jgi:hypothetical protein
MNRVCQKYFEKTIKYRFGAFKDNINLRFIAMEKATQLAAKIDSDIQRERSAELSKHLEHLNNEAGRLAADKVTTADLKEMNSRLQALEKLAAIAVFLAVAIPICLQVALNYFKATK